MSLVTDALDVTSLPSGIGPPGIAVVRVETGPLFPSGEFPGDRGARSHR